MGRRVAGRGCTFGLGGLGGGGNAGYTTNGSGVPNTGGGAGGIGGATATGTGGSGVVIVSYPASGAVSAVTSALFSGAVGIGTTSPAAALDVAGSVNATQLCMGGVCHRCGFGVLLPLPRPSAATIPGCAQAGCPARSCPACRACSWACSPLAWGLP